MSERRRKKKKNKEERRRERSEEIVEERRRRRRRRGKEKEKREEHNREEKRKRRREREKKENSTQSDKVMMMMMIGRRYRDIHNTHTHTEHSTMLNAELAPHFQILSEKGRREESITRIALKINYLIEIKLRRRRIRPDKTRQVKT